MKGHPFVFLLAASLLAAPAYAAGCNPYAQKRVVKGQQPTADTLYARTRNLGSWVSGFEQETFVYIGDVHVKSGKSEKIFKIGHLHTLAGRTCIPFDRLFIFDANDNYVGQYFPVVVAPKKVKIQGSVLVFPFKPKDGNKLDLSNGPPANVRLDGDTPDWEPAPEPESGQGAPPP